MGLIGYLHRTSIVLRFMQHRLRLHRLMQFAVVGWSALSYCTVYVSVWLDALFG